MIIDTHAHYDDRAFDADREEILCQMKERGIYAVNSGADLASSRTSMELARSHGHIRATVGIHPENAGEADDVGVLELKKLVLSDTEHLIVGIGEIGLDYHYEDAPDRETQEMAFRRQLDLAKDMGLPVVVHSRDAAEDTFRILRDTAYEGRRFDLHCYGYSAEMAERFLDMGAYFGIGGVLTFKNGRKLREAVQRLPLTRLLLETDAPYLAPDPHRGERNCSLYLPRVVEELAKLKGITAEEVMEITMDNARTFYTEWK